MATKSRIFIEQRREIEKVLLGGEDCIRSKFYDLYADINRYGRLVADQSRNINELVMAGKVALAWITEVLAGFGVEDGQLHEGHPKTLLETALAAVEETL